MNHVCLMRRSLFSLLLLVPVYFSFILGLLFIILVEFLSAGCVYSDPKDSPLRDQMEQCADCHPQHVEGFKKTGMGRSLYPVNQASVIENYKEGSAVITHPITGVIYEAKIDKEGRWWQIERHPKQSYKRAVEVKYVIGSGNHTRSYMGEVDGELIELPLTWYTRRSIWDMSPGYQRRDHFRFSRPIKASCLFCHNDLSPIKEGTLAHYKGEIAHGITCVRCHGEGSTHIKTRLNGVEFPKGAADPSILNPAHLSPKRQNQICQQCHLTGVARVLLPGRSWDVYDPRTPLEEYIGIFGYDDETHQTRGSAFGIASHAERLKLSRCVQKRQHKNNKDKNALSLQCTICHDPHAPQSQSMYQQACLKCHTQEQCGRKHQADSKDTLCFQCHMRRGETSDIPHVQFTDHWIRVRPKDTPKTPKKSRSLVSLLPPLADGDQVYEIGLRGIAHANLVNFNQLSEHHPKALELLTQAVDLTPMWPDLWRELGDMFIKIGRYKEASIAYYKYVQHRPRDLSTRLKEAQNLSKLQMFKEAEYVLRELLRFFPNHWQVMGDLANLLQQHERFEEAEALYDRIDLVAPHVSATAFNRGYIPLQRGQLDQAHRWFKEGERRDGVGREAPFHLGVLATQKGAHLQAIQLFTESLTRDPNFTQALFLKGLSQLQLQRHQEAEETFTQMMKRTPSDARSYLWLSRSLLQRREPIRAKELLKIGIEKTASKELEELLKKIP